MITLTLFFLHYYIYKKMSHTILGVSTSTEKDKQTAMILAKKGWNVATTASYPISILAQILFLIRRIISKSWFFAIVRSKIKKGIK